MPLLPFKVSQKSEETKTISDGFGNSLEIPFRGCLNFAEDHAISQYYLKFDGSATRAEVQLAVVTIFLRERFNLPDLTPEQVAQEAVTMPMIDRLAEFIENERNRWVPSKVLLDVSGSEAEETAWLCAQRTEGVMTSRKDLVAQKRFIVFQSLDDVSDDFEIIKDFSKGKSQSPTNRVSR